MTRAITLIKMYFMASLRALTADIARRMSEKVPSSHSHSSILIQEKPDRMSLQLHKCISYIHDSGAYHPNWLPCSESSSVRLEPIQKNWPHCCPNVIEPTSAPGKACLSTA